MWHNNMYCACGIIICIVQYILLCHMHKWLTTWTIAHVRSSMTNQPYSYCYTVTLIIATYIVCKSLHSPWSLLYVTCSEKRDHLGYLQWMHRSAEPSPLHACMTTVSKKDTAVAAKAAVDRPKADVGRRRAAHRMRLAAAAQLHPPICLKIDSLAYEWLTRLLSRTHAQAASLSVCLCHRPHDMV